jgi:hypothetical protein
MKSLQIEQSNINKTANALKQVELTGQFVNPVKDSRTTTEKYMDTYRLKNELEIGLYEIMSPDEAQSVVSELDENEVQFGRTQLQSIINDLKPKFALGVPAKVFANYLRTLLEKFITNDGVENSGKTTGSNALLSSFTDIYDTKKKKEEEEKEYTLKMLKEEALRNKELQKKREEEAKKSGGSKSGGKKSKSGGSSSYQDDIKMATDAFDGKISSSGLNSVQQYLLTWMQIGESIPKDEINFVLKKDNYDKDVAMQYVNDPTLDISNLTKSQRIVYDSLVKLSSSPSKSLPLTFNDSLS